MGGPASISYAAESCSTPDAPDHKIIARTELRERRHRAGIAVALRPQIGEHMYCRLRLLAAREVADRPAPGDVSATGLFGGQPVITVSKQLDRPQNVRMSLGPVEADPDGVHLRCFLYLSIQVGSGDRGQEGYALLNLETSTLREGPHRDPPTPPGGQEP
jgi:hypothetical protein